MKKIEELEVTQDLLVSAARVFVAVAIQTNSTKTTVKLEELLGDEYSEYGEFKVVCTWKQVRGDTDGE